MELDLKYMYEELEKIKKDIDKLQRVVAILGLEEYGL